MIRFEKPFFKNEFFFFLLPFLSILHRFVEHLEAIRESDALLLYLIYVLWMVAFFVLFLFIFKNPRKAFLFIFFLFFFNFYFGVFHDWVKLNFDNSYLSRYSIILPFIVLIIG